MESIPQKHCPECDETKQIDKFSRDKQCPDGLQWRCKQCNSARGRAYYQANRDRVIARTRQYQIANPDVREKAKRSWNERNRDQYLTETRNRSVRWRAANLEKSRAAGKRRYARKHGAKGSHTLAEWEALKALHGYRCLCCGKQEPKIALTLDHVMPLSKGGSDYIDNIQPLCANCNSSKRARATDYRPSLPPLQLSFDL